MSQLNAHGILVKAREIISDPARWTKEAYAKASDDFELGNPLSPVATCWCSLGALHRASNCGPNDAFPAPHVQARHALDLALTARAQRSIVDFNDAPETTHADVLKLFDDAIAIAAQPLEQQP